MNYTGKSLKVSGKVFKGRTEAAPTPWKEAYDRSPKTAGNLVRSRQNEKNLKIMRDGTLTNKLQC